MRKSSSLLALLFGFAGMHAASAQDLDVQGDAATSEVVFRAKNIKPKPENVVAIVGHSVPSMERGIGVVGRGGYKGVIGEAINPYNSMTVTTVVGIIGEAKGTGTKHGVRAVAVGAQGVNIGIYGEAYGSGRAGLFSGDVEYSGALFNPSDRALKRDIKDIRKCLPLIAKLAPKEFRYRTEEFEELNLPRVPQFGFIAQEVEGLLPGLVSESVSPGGRISEASAKESASRGYAPSAPVAYKSLNYLGMIPILIGAVKEQQAQLDALEKGIARLGK